MNSIGGFFLCQNSLFRLIVNLRFLCFFLRLCVSCNIFFIYLYQLIKININ